MMPETHPVIRALRRSDVLERRSVDYLAARGRPYQGVPLPDGIRHWPIGACIEASEAMAREHGWGRVQGWSIAPKSLVGEYPPIYHEWNSTDGETALDASVPDPQRFLYWGVPYPENGRADMMVIGQPARPRRVIPLDLMPGAFARSLERSFRL